MRGASLPGMPEGFNEAEAIKPRNSSMVRGLT